LAAPRLRPAENTISRFRPSFREVRPLFPGLQACCPRQNYEHSRVLGWNGEQIAAVIVSGLVRFLI
jgi:hypothetical protein